MLRPAADLFQTIPDANLCGFRCPDQIFFWSADGRPETELAEEAIGLDGAVGVLQIWAVPARKAAEVANGWAQSVQEAATALDADVMDPDVLAWVGHWVTGGSVDLVGGYIASDNGYLFEAGMESFDATDVSEAAHPLIGGGDDEFCAILGEALQPDAEGLSDKAILDAVMASAHPPYVNEYVSEDWLEEQLEFNVAPDRAPKLKKRLEAWRAQCRKAAESGQ